VTSDNSLLLILRRLDEIERKLDDMEELRTTRAIRRRWQRGTNVWRKVTSPARGTKRLTSDRQRGAIVIAVWSDLFGMP